MIVSALADNALSDSMCNRQYRKFQTGNFDLSDKHRSGTPKKVKDEQLDQLLQQNSYQTQKEHSEQLGITQQSIFYLFQNLSPENKERCYNTAVCLLSRFYQKDFQFKSVTRDEKWVLYDNPKGEKHGFILGEPSTSTSKPNVWWDMEGVLQFELLKPGKTVTFKSYQEQLMRLSDKIKRKPDSGKGTLLLLSHDNAQRRTCGDSNNLTILRVEKFSRYGPFRYPPVQFSATPSYCSNEQNSGGHFLARSYIIPEKQLPVTLVYSAQQKLVQKVYTT